MSPSMLLKRSQCMMFMSSPESKKRTSTSVLATPTPGAFFDCVDVHNHGTDLLRTRMYNALAETASGQTLKISAEERRAEDAAVSGEYWVLYL